MSGNVPLVEPPTTRIGGGGSAHAVAIGVVVVLVALVWVGWSGRPGAPAGAPLASAAAPTAVAAGISPTPAAATPRILPTEPPATLLPNKRLADDVYLVTAGFSEFGVEDGGMLREVAPDQLRAVIHMPFRSPIAVPEGDGESARIQVHQFSSAAATDGYLQLGEWELTSFAHLEPSTFGSVLQARVAAQYDSENPSLLIRRGYRLEVRAQRQKSMVELVVEIRVLPETRRPRDEDHRIFPLVR